MQARERAFASVFGVAAPAVAKAPAFASLKALRQAHKISMPALAAKLGLGVDVVSALEAGRIRAASAPERALSPARRDAGHNRRPDLGLARRAASG